MLKRIINTAQIELDIIPVDPLLVKSGQATVSGVDMSFVRTYRYGEKEEPFIPGSSLKGVIRSYAERICRSLRDNPVPVCLPYVVPGKEESNERQQASCGLRFEKFKKENKSASLPSTDIYRLSCPACRLFGSHRFVGRLGVSDAYLTEDFKSGSTYVIENRDGVAIDRFTGGAASGAKYDLEVLTRGEFGTSIEIRNFERWQLGLVALVLRDMCQGLIRVGSGKSRGLGRIRAKITECRLSYYNRKPEYLAGLDMFCTDEERTSYGLFPESSSGATPLPAPASNGLRNEYDVTETWKETLAPAVDDFVAYVAQVDWPQALVQFVDGRS
jgi:CRISPR-associated RAMP protein (TIGR02581 family)